MMWSLSKSDLCYDFTTNKDRLAGGNQEKCKGPIKASFYHLQEPFK